jgi:2-oxoglutarate dehydrogenase E1 component
MLQPFRKPLIVMSPKSLLRHKDAQSSLAEMTAGSFRTVLDDPEQPKSPHTLIFCSGKVYFDLDARRRERGLSSVAIVRIEQLYPWPEEHIRAVIERYGDVKRVAWVQEESRNRGGWRFVQNRLADITGVENIDYVGREASSSPATGSFREHQGELQRILAEALGPAEEAAGKT